MLHIRVRCSCSYSCISFCLFVCLFQVFVNDLTLRGVIYYIALEGCVMLHIRARCSCP